MRVTVHIPDQLGNQIKYIAKNNNTSVSSFAANALEFYIKENKKKNLGNKLLKLAGKGHVSLDAIKTLDDGRSDDRI